MALAVPMYWSSTPLAPALRCGAIGEEIRWKAQGCREVCGLPGSGAGSPHTQPATSLTHPQCTEARRQAGQTPQ